MAKKLNKVFLLMICITFCFSTCFALPSFAIVNGSKQYNNATNAVSNKVITTNAPMFNFKAKGVVLLEPKSGKIMYTQSEHERVYPASTTKIMTMLLLMQAIEQGKVNLSDTISISDYASSMGGSQVYAKPGETFTVEEALKAVCISSANDMCVAIAEKIAGSTDNFVGMMNQEAKRLGMNDTNFRNPHGLDDPEHYTCAYDMAMLSKEIVNKYPQILSYTSIWMDSLRNGAFGLSSTNKLLKSYTGANGLKTGSTSIALYSICASAVRDNMNLIAIIMSAPDSNTRFDEAKQLLDYGFTNFRCENLNKEEIYKDTIKVEKGKTDTLELLYEKETATVLEKGNNSKIETKINLPETIIAPISQNQIIGNITYLINDTPIEVVNIVSSSAIEKANLLDNINKMISCILIKK